MMILIDVSNTMSSEKLHIAIETTRAILDTLSNNDFVNVLKIGATTEETIHCFKDVLAQVGYTVNQISNRLNLFSTSRLTTIIKGGSRIRLKL